MWSTSARGFQREPSPAPGERPAAPIARPGLTSPRLATTEPPRPPGPQARPRPPPTAAASRPHPSSAAAGAAGPPHRRRRRRRRGGTRRRPLPASPRRAGPPPRLPRRRPSSGGRPPRQTLRLRPARLAQTSSASRWRPRRRAPTGCGARCSSCTRGGLRPAGAPPETRRRRQVVLLTHSTRRCRRRRRAPARQHPAAAAARRSWTAIWRICLTTSAWPCWPACAWEASRQHAPQQRRRPCRQRNRCRWNRR